MSPYILANLPEESRQLIRVLQDMTDRINSLSGEMETARNISKVDAAQKENVTEGVLFIPSQDVGGNSGFIRVSKDGVIVDYTNPTETLFPYTDLTLKGTITTGLDPLHVPVQILPGTLSQNGDYLKIVYGGQYASNANAKRVTFTITGSTNFEDTGLIDIRSLGWVLNVSVYRMSSVQVLVQTVLDAGILQTDSAGVNTVTAIGGRMNQRAGYVTVPNLNTNPISLFMQGEGTATNDVTQYLTNIEFYRSRQVKLV